MSNITVRQVYGDEMAEIMYLLTSYAFNASPPLPDKAERLEMFKQREGSVYFAAFQDGQAVSCTAFVQMTQQVRGKVMPMGGVWGVAAHPAARRQGCTRQALIRLLQAIHEENRPVSCLYPFRESFYERLGYVTWPQPRQVKFSPANLQPLVKKNLGGEIEWMLIGDGLDAYRDYVYRMQQRTHGMSVFDYANKAQVQKRNSSWLALARVNGSIAGLLVYELKGDEITQFTLRANRFYYDHSQARYLLLQWIAQHIDQAQEVEIWLPPAERPETWLPDLKITSGPIFHAPMSRIVHVAGIQGIQAGTGRFTARINDPICPWNEGVWEFSGNDGILEVRRGDVADCDLEIQGLTALVYGLNDPEDFIFRGWGSPPPQTCAVMRAMFPPTLPYMHEFF